MTTSRHARHAVAALLLIAAAGAVTAFATPARVHIVTVTAKDYSFDAPDTLPQGFTTIRLLNRGKELHHVQLIRLGGTHTMKDLFDALGAGGPPPAWVTMVGGPNAAAPGGEATATLDLQSGLYAMICLVPSPDGKPHVMKGMAKALHVMTGPRDGERASIGAPASTLTLTDYKFDLSRPLVAGRNTLRVKNLAAQTHEVLVVKLAPGKTVGDMAAWAEKPVGPPPAMPLGGATGIDRGGWNDVTLDLTPGTYGLLCFFPDAKDGKPHVAHGMMSQFEVK